MQIDELLSSLSDENLESLARDKVTDIKHIRLPRKVIIKEIREALTSFSYISKTLALRYPPNYQMILVLLNGEEHSCPVQDYRNKVIDETNKMNDLANNLVSGNRRKNYKLYLKMLQTAWESELSIDMSEEALLQTLRDELGITFNEHLVLMHHSELKQLWDRSGAYEKERNFLLSRGIILSTESYYVIAEEVIPIIKAAWQIELGDAQYKRLLSYLSNEILYQLLKINKLPLSGTKSDKMAMIISSMISPRSLLRQMRISDIQSTCKRAKCAIYGTKEEVIDRIIEYLTSDRDLLKDVVEKPDKPEELIEEKELNKSNFVALLTSLTNGELYHICSNLEGLRVSGTKRDKALNLLSSRYSEKTMLTTLRNQDLSEICFRHNLLKSGSKGDLIDRILDNARVKPKSDEVDPISEAGDERPPEVTEKPSNHDLADKLEEYNNVNTLYPRFTIDEKVILSFLLEMKSLNEDELDRIIASYKLSWFLPKAHMKDLKRKLEDKKAKHKIIVKPYKYYNIYEVME